jgi:hypothetical protein
MTEVVPFRKALTGSVSGRLRPLVNAAAVEMIREAGGVG